MRVEQIDENKQRAIAIALRGKGRHLVNDVESRASGLSVPLDRILDAERGKPLEALELGVGLEDRVGNIQTNHAVSTT